MDMPHGMRCSRLHMLFCSPPAWHDPLSGIPSKCHKPQQPLLPPPRRLLPLAAAGPRDVRLHLAASVQDVVVQDLRAAPEHCQVLVPSGGESYCSLDCSYTAYVDGRRMSPSLVVQVQVSWWCCRCVQEGWWWCRPGQGVCG